MGTFKSLTASDGHQFDAYVAQPSGKPKAGIVVLQEIFGVNSHIREVADLYASQGYYVVAPPTMSRVRNAIELGYTDADMQAGFAAKLEVDALPNNPVMLDIQAAINEAKTAGKVGIVGYCWGGLLTWKSAAQLSGLSAAVPYYGGGIPDHIALSPKCPVMAHFANDDSYIPLDAVEAFSKAHPEVEIHIYEGHHGFNCDHRAAYNETAAKAARQRTFDFFAKQLA